MFDLGRMPPQNIDAEKAVLGSLMVDKTVIPGVLEILKPEHFYRDTHSEIYASIIEFFNEGVEPDIIEVPNRLMHHGTLEQCGGIETLAAMISDVPIVQSARHYATIVREKALLRQVIKSSVSIQEAAYQQKDIQDINTELDKLQIELDSETASTTLKTNKFTEIFRQDLKQRIENHGKLPGISSGFRFYDYKTGGLIPTALHIIAARPAMGKTALLLCIIAFIAGYLKKPVLFFSLEMSRQQILQRLACLISEIEVQKVRTGNMTNEEFSKIDKALSEVEAWPLYIDDSPGLSLQDVSAKSRKISMIEKDLGLICLDHLTEMAIEGKDERQGVTANVRGLKRLSKQLNVPFILLCQLNRAVETRQVKRPCLADLRESGAIEETGDVISFLYRDSYYNPEADDREAELIIGKNRDGETGTIPLHWYKSIMKFKTPINPF